MPLEVRELIMKARIDSSSNRAAAAPRSASETEMIVRQAAEQVLRALKDQKER